ncbi:MAG: hypothetical protein KTR14_07145 [Vampirovibrio sp.]|nr:hypothetical protein [Vampirovibrio sp.]
MENMILPDFQPVPFPAPLWLLKTLLVLGFYLHAVPMNVALMGGLVSALYLLKGKADPQSNAHRLGHSLALSLPFFVSFAITQGIVPLLFLQLVYGPLFYTSSILMGVPWILLLVALIIGYYGLYAYKLRHQQIGSRAPWMLMGVSILFLGIAFLFTNNMTLMLTPEKWPAVVHQDQVGFFFNLTEPQLIPRYLHFVFAAVAVTGLAIGCFGLYLYKRDNDYASWLIQQGAGLYLIITLVQVGIGGWFLMSLPKAQMMSFMGQDTLGTAVFAGSMILSLVSIVTMAMAWKDGKPGMFKIGLGSALLVILLMVQMRHLLREYAVSSFFAPQNVPVETQWDLLIVFIVSAIGLIIYLGWLLKIVWNAFRHNPQHT